MRDSRNGRTTGAIALAVSLAMVPAMVPSVAVASGASAAGAITVGTDTGFAAAVPGAWTQAMVVAKKKKKKKRSKKPSGTLTAEGAEPKREAIRAAVADKVAKEDWKGAADETEENAILLGDPISYQEAAEFRFQQAQADRDIDAANEAIEMATVALDILHFYTAVEAGEAVSEWQPIEPSAASSFIGDTEAIISRSEALIEEIEAEQAAEDGGGGAATPAAKQKRQRNTKPGTELIALGSVFSVIGAGGLSMVAAGTVISSQKQKEVEGLTLPDDQAEVERLDQEGSKANLIAYIVAGVAVAGLAVGVPLIVVGVMKRKKGGNPPASAKLRVVPAMSRSFGGVSLQGRF